MSPSLIPNTILSLNCLEFHKIYNFQGLLHFVRPQNGHIRFVISSNKSLTVTSESCISEKPLWMFTITESVAETDFPQPTEIWFIWMLISSIFDFFFCIHFVDHSRRFYLWIVLTYVSSTQHNLVTCYTKRPAFVTERTVTILDTRFQTSRLPRLFFLWHFVFYFRVLFSLLWACYYFFLSGKEIGKLVFD